MPVKEKLIAISPRIEFWVAERDSWDKVLRNLFWTLRAHTLKLKFIQLVVIHDKTSLINNKALDNFSRSTNESINFKFVCNA